METSIAEALPRLAARLGGGLARVERLSGGASQETFLLVLKEAAGERELILRRRPQVAAPAAAEAGSGPLPLALEARLIAAAREAGVPVPQVVAVLAAADGLGEAYVMERVEGETLGGRIVRDPSFETARAGLARACGETLARIHRLPVERFPELRRADAGEELARTEELYRSLGLDRPALEWGFRRLARDPPSARLRLLHGDFRTGNLMVRPETGLAAVLDWELAHIGPAAADLAWLCVNSWRFGRSDRPVGGFGLREELLEGYAAGGGEPVETADLLWHEALGSLKWGVMCLMMCRASLAAGERSVERAMIGRRASEAEIDLLNALEVL